MRTNLEPRKAHGPLNAPRRIQTSALALLLALWAGPVLAAHGVLTGTIRDAAINGQVQDLVLAGLAPTADKPVADLTNLQVAQLTEAAVEKRGDKPNTADPSLGSLVREFRVELAALGVDVSKLEDRIYDARRRNERFAETQQKELRKTGTKITGDARSLFANYRSFGPHAVYGPMDFNDILYADIRLKSVPIPSVLFDLDFRATRSIGLRYNNEVLKPTYDIRWIALTQAGEGYHFTAGDFWKNYSPLVLWNPENPVGTLTEPTPYYRSRKNLEEFLFLDHGPDWRLRGLEAGADPEWSDGGILKTLHVQAMTGLLKSANLTGYAEGYFGSQAGADLFDRKFQLKANGLVLQDDPGSTALPYLPTFISTHAKRQTVGSLEGTVRLPLPDDLEAASTWEWAHSRYEEVTPNPEIRIDDWAILGNGSVKKGDLELTVKYLNNGPQFYSPGAQTNRTTPASGTPGYLTSNLNLDDGLNGYLDHFVFQGVGRPAFAPYDRLTENVLPYGDATPNREALFLGFSGKVGKEGWIQPQALVSLKAKEFQPNYVLTGIGGTVLPVDSQPNTAVARKFQTAEAAVSLDLAKVIDSLPKTCSLSVDFKHQSSDPSMGGNPWTVHTLLLGSDFGPFRKVPFLGGMVLSAAYRWVQSRGDEYNLTGVGTLPTLAGYASILDTAQLGAYSYGPLNLNATSLAFGFKYELSSKFTIHGEYFQNETRWLDVPGYARRDQVWKISNDITF